MQVLKEGSMYSQTIQNSKEINCKGQCSRDRHQS
jgi:hypothetical protein